MKNRTLRGMLGVTALCATICGGSYAAFAEQTTNLTTTDQYEAPASTDTKEDSSSSDSSASASTANQKQERDTIISYHFSPAIAAGTEITVSDADGNVVFSATAQTDISMICFSSENLEDGEYTIKAGAAEDTITVSTDQSKRHGHHGIMNGSGMMPGRDNRQTPDTNSGSTPKMPGSNDNNTQPSLQGNHQMPQM